MNMLKHYVHPSIVSGLEPVQIALIGAGGTGSQHCFKRYLIAENSASDMTHKYNYIFFHT